MFELLRDWQAIKQNVKEVVTWRNTGWRVWLSWRGDLLRAFGTSPWPWEQGNIDTTLSRGRGWGEEAVRVTLHCSSPDRYRSWSTLFPCPLLCGFFKVSFARPGHRETKQGRDVWNGSGEQEWRFCLVFFLSHMKQQETKKWPAVQYQCQQAWSKPMPSCNRVFFSVKILSQVPSGLPLYDNKNTNAVIWFSFWKRRDNENGKHLKWMNFVQNSEHSFYRE